MAQGSAHSPGEQEIFVPGGEGWKQREGEREREIGTLHSPTYYLYRFVICTRKIDTQSRAAMTQGARAAVRFLAAGLEAKPTVCQSLTQMELHTKGQSRDRARDTGKSL